MLPLLVSGQADKQPLASNGIYLTDSDYIHHHLTDPFKRDHHHKLNTNKKDHLIVKLDSLDHVYYYDEIWGYRQDGEDWRIYNDEYYKIDYVKEICLYEIPGSGQGEGMRTTHYFSKTTTSPIHAISKNNLIHAYQENSVFVARVKGMKLTESVFRKDSTGHNYLFVHWLRE
jgi:hypothetical protein